MSKENNDIHYYNKDMNVILHCHIDGGGDMIITFDMKEKTDKETNDIFNEMSISGTTKVITKNKAKQIKRKWQKKK